MAYKVKVSKNKYKLLFFTLCLQCQITITSSVKTLPFLQRVFLYPIRLLY